MESLKLEKGLLKITAALVGLFSLILFFNLLSFKPKLEAKTQTTAQRTPASIAPGGVSWETTPALKEMETSLPCINGGESYNLESPTSRLRIGAKLCTAKEDLKETTIVNKSNGFVATVFHINPKEFTTDLIDLIPGENQIHVSHLLSNGKTLLSQVVISYK